MYVNHLVHGLTYSRCSEYVVVFVVLPHLPILQTGKLIRVSTDKKTLGQMPMLLVLLGVRALLS